MRIPESGLAFIISPFAPRDIHCEICNCDPSATDICIFFATLGAKSASFRLSPLDLMAQLNDWRVHSCREIAIPLGKRQSQQSVQWE
tara:strand:- start:148 stop:408 length:261 start_codon:yes stop_codon:yes gene_type:complete